MQFLKKALKRAGLVLLYIWTAITILTLCVIFPVGMMLHFFEKGEILNGVTTILSFCGLYVWGIWGFYHDKKVAAANKMATELATKRANELAIEQAVEAQRTAALRLGLWVPTYGPVEDWRCIADGTANLQRMAFAILAVEKTEGIMAFGAAHFLRSEWSRIHSELMALGWEPTRSKRDIFEEARADIRRPAELRQHLRAK